MGMMIYILLSALPLALSIVLAVRWFVSGRVSALRLAGVTLLVVLSVLIARFPLYSETEPFVTSVLHGLISGMQTIGLDESLPDLMEKSGEVFGAGSAAFDLYMSLQYVCAPLICGLTLIRAIIGLTATTRLFFCLRPVYFFSSLNEESVVLAESIGRSMRGRVLFCFTAPEDGAEGRSGLLGQRARRSGAMVMPMKPEARLFPRGSRHITCVLSSRDEMENVKELSRLLHEERSGPHREQTVKYFVFACSAQAEQAVDAMAEKHRDDPNTAVFMISPMENLAAHILGEHPLYRYCGRTEDGRARMHVLIVGSTPLADWFLRTAYPCGQLCGCDFSITLAAQDAQAYRARLLADVPMLRRTEHPLVRDCGALEFVTLEHAAEAALPELLADKDYVFLALDGDEENALLAGRVSAVINRQKLTDERRAAQSTAVVYVVQDQGLNDLYRQLYAADAEACLPGCEMIAVGSLESQYQVSVLFEHELLHRAFFVDRAYSECLGLSEGTDAYALLQKDFIGFMNRAYVRRSSAAFALQLDYYRQQLESGGAQALERLAEAEHRRWAAYTIMDGFDEPTREQLLAYLYRDGNRHKSGPLKLHPCLVTGMTDDFEVLGRMLDEALEQRLLAALEAAGAPLDCPDGASPEERKRAIIGAAQGIADKQARRIAVKMGSALYTDYRALDRGILEHVQAIHALTQDPGVQRALNQFWL